METISAKVGEIFQEGASMNRKWSDESRNLFYNGATAARRVLLLAALLGVLFAVPGSAKVSAEHCADADQIFYNGTVVTMATPPTASGIAVKNGRITAVGDGEAILERCRSGATVVHDLNHKTMTPGFISSHSHLSLFGLWREWVDVSSVNAFFHPNWKPLRTTDEILTKLKQEVANASVDGKPKDPDHWITAYAYDPSRQTGTPLDRDSLDQVSEQIPILVMNNSGHWIYVNSAALNKMNICDVSPKPGPDCTIPYPPLTTMEKEFARQGKLMSAAAAIATDLVTPTGWLENLQMLRNSAEVFAQHGYTTAADADPSQDNLQQYFELVADPEFPVSVVALPTYACYDDTKESPCFSALIKKELPEGYTLGPIKFWADGSPQGYTAGMLDPYYLIPENVLPPPPAPSDCSPSDKGSKKCPPPPPLPCSDPFEAPPDRTRTDNGLTYWGSSNFNENPCYGPLLKKAYRNGYDVAIHTNGDYALEQTLIFLEEAQQAFKKEHPGEDPPGIQFIHLAYARPGQVKRIKELGGVVTFLIGDLYYWGQVECQQIFGPKRVNGYEELVETSGEISETEESPSRGTYHEHRHHVPGINYPVGFATNQPGLGMDVPYSLHSDAPIAPPDPLFLMWMAVTRKVQLWSGPATPSCPEVLGAEHRISIEEALKAFTTSAAFQFGLENSVGSLELHKVADMTILSQNPLSFAENPDGLLDIKVVATVNRGTYHRWWSPHEMGMAPAKSHEIGTQPASMGRN